MKLYIDITNMISLEYLTGIQRVVQEVVSRLINNNRFEIELLNFDNQEDMFYIFNQNQFLEQYTSGEFKINSNKDKQYLKLEEMDKNSIFFDIDAVWNLKISRSFLYRKLKQLDIKIVTFVHDIIPITNPEYCHLDTVCKFMNYIGATICYADEILVSTEATREEIKKLMYKTNSKLLEIGVTWLGADFKKYNKDEKLNYDIIREIEGKKYVLIVGTIEPRKNHKIVLEAFDKQLYEQGLTLVFVGRYGWNIDELKKEIENHEQKDRKFYHFDNANDITVDYLYRNAFLSIYPSFNEGFGLPIIEALERGCPVISSDCKVLKEVGKNYCQYFIQNNVDDLIQNIKKYHIDSELYNEWKNKISEFNPLSWDSVIKNIEAELDSIRNR